MEPQRRIDPKLAKFLARHAVSEEEAVEADVSRHRGQSPAESWADAEGCCRAAMLMVRAGGHALERLALERDEPHPSYWPTLRRLMKSRRGA